MRGDDQQQPDLYRRRNDTHQSTTDREARLYRKSLGQEAKLVFQGHVLMENRHGLVVETRLTSRYQKVDRAKQRTRLGELRLPVWPLPFRARAIADVSRVYQMGRDWIGFVGSCGALAVDASEGK